jgi:hypothetical protein
MRNPHMVPVMTMDKASSFTRHSEAVGSLAVNAEDLFTYLDKHSQLSAHMTKSSWMMGGGRMDMTTDEGGFRKLGSKLRLAGKAFGLTVFLEEEVANYAPPLGKAWQTIGAPKLLVIGAYRMGFDIEREPAGARLRVFIDYDLPGDIIGRIAGFLLGGFYARWCVTSMLMEAQKRFETGP